MKEKKSNKINNICKVVIFALLLAIALRLTYGVLSWKDTTGDYLSVTKQLEATDKNLMDVVFFGSSHCYCSIYPAYLWENYGMAAFDMAVSGQDKASTYHALVEVLKTQSPKVVCVDLYGLLFDRHQVEGNVYRNMMALPTSLNSISLVKEYVEPERQKDFIARWPIVHTRYAELEKYDFQDNPASEYGRGAYMEWVSTYGEVAEGVENVVEAAGLSAANEAWLNRLIALSEKEDFELILFMAPSYVTIEEQEVINGAEKYALERQITMIDFNKIRAELGLNSETDFVDNYHCNALGAAKVTGLFGMHLSQNFDFPDHRGDNRYALWEKDAMWFHHLEYANRLKSSENLQETVEILKEQKDSGEYIIVAGLEGNFEAAEDYYTEQLYHLGVDRTQIADGGKWIIDGGAVREVSNNTAGEAPFVMDLGKTDSLKIQFVEDLSAENIMINRELKNAHFYNMTILVYDKWMQKLVAELAY